MSPSVLRMWISSGKWYSESNLGACTQFVIAQVVKQRIATIQNSLSLSLTLSRAPSVGLTLNFCLPLSPHNFPHNQNITYDPINSNLDLLSWVDRLNWLNCTYIGAREPINLSN